MNMSQVDNQEKDLPVSVVGDPFFDPISSSADDKQNGLFSSNFYDRNADSGDPLNSSFGDFKTSESEWPWGHIFQPNERGRTEVACTEDMNSDQLCSSGSELEDPSTAEQLLGPHSSLSPNRHNSASDLVHLINRSSLSSPNSTTEDEGVDDGLDNARMRHCQSDPDLLEHNNSHDNIVDSPSSPRRRSGDVISMRRTHIATKSTDLGVPESVEMIQRVKSSSAGSSYECIPSMHIDMEQDTRSSIISDNIHSLTQSLSTTRSPLLRKKKLSPRLPIKSSSPSHTGKKIHGWRHKKTESKLKTGQSKIDGSAKSPSKGKIPDKSHSSSKLHQVSDTQNSIIAEHLRQYKENYCDKEHFRFFVGTWNVNGKSPECTLSDYLACYKGGILEEKRRLIDDDVHWEELREPPHVFALGFQELDLSPEALLPNKDSPKEPEWIESVRSALKMVGRYKLIHSIRLVGMLLVVFVEESLSRFVSEVESDYIGTGIMGIMGNKGGVAVRMKLHETTVCFVNSHLPAHMEEVEKRNEDFKQIRLQLFSDQKGIDRHDIVFWCGDLNYRIQTSDMVTVETIKKMADLYQLQGLVAKDQLTNQRKEKKVFEDFEEGPLTFKPSYKYDPGTDKWDSSEKGRVPAWCDRVLWRTKTAFDVQLIDYISHPKMLISDHKPVSALFDVKVMVPDKERRALVLEEAFRKVDKTQNDCLPQVSLDTQEVIFGDVYYSDILASQIRVSNTGQVPVTINFQKKMPDDDDFCASWLTVRPRKETIWPRDYCNFLFVAEINIDTAERVVKGIDKMEDILVLHLHDGKDYFITVNGNYKLSAFGSSLHVLRYMAHKGGIRGLPREEVAKMYEPNSVAVSSGSGAPLELWKLVDHLFKFGLNSEDLFIDEGKNTEIKTIREFLDSGGALTDKPIPGSIQSVAQVFVLFLESLAEPIVPYDLHTKCMEAGNDGSLCRQILHEMPEIHRNCFVYIMMFLKEIVSNSSVNNSDPKFLSSLFGSVLLRQDPSGPAAKRKSKRGIDKKKAAFILRFLLENLL